MKASKRPYNPKRTHILRIVVGAYLLYTVYSLIKEFDKSDANQKYIVIGFIIFFSITALVLLITSTIAWLKLLKEEKMEDTTDDTPKDDE
jgi:branched-subunit amino acid ABC-type transport system permease component